MPAAIETKMSEIRDASGMAIPTCPSESDPRGKVAGFVSDPEVPAIAGLKMDGLQFLVDLVIDEIRKQEPESEIIMLDRDFLSDNRIDFARDLSAAVDARTRSGRRVYWIVIQDLPVMDWQGALQILKGRDSQVLFFSTMCRQVPACFKLLLD